MTDRGFSEIDLRSMLQHASAHRADVVPGRWVIETKHRRTSWEVILEPDERVELLVVITAYPVEA